MKNNTFEKKEKTESKMEIEDGDKINMNRKKLKKLKKKLIK